MLVNCSSPVDAALLLSSKDLGLAVFERMKNRQNYQGAELECIVGELDGQRVACAWPRAIDGSWGKLLNAVITAHRPERLLAVGEVVAAPDAPDTSAPDTNSPGANSIVKLDEPTALKYNAFWLNEITSASRQAGLPAELLGVVTRRPAGDDWRHFSRQTSLAGKAGAVLGALWRRPAFAKEAWGRAAGQWADQDALADVIQSLLSDPVSDAPQPDTT